MSHLAARVLTVLREGRPYELRDAEGKPISREEARGLLSKYRVPEEIRREKRRRNPAKGSGRTLRKKTQGMALRRTSKAASAPQSAVATPIPHDPVYRGSA